MALNGVPSDTTMANCSLAICLIPARSFTVLYGSDYATAYVPYGARATSLYVE
jgi:hypothetical protein